MMDTWCNKGRYCNTVQRIKSAILGSLHLTYGSLCKGKVNSGIMTDVLISTLASRLNFFMPFLVILRGPVGADFLHFMFCLARGFEDCGFGFSLVSKGSMALGIFESRILASRLLVLILLLLHSSWEGLRRTRVFVAAFSPTSKRMHRLCCLFNTCNR